MAARGRHPKPGPRRPHTAGASSRPHTSRPRAADRDDPRRLEDERRSRGNVRGEGRFDEERRPRAADRDDPRRVEDERRSRGNVRGGGKFEAGRRSRAADPAIGNDSKGAASSRSSEHVRSQPRRARNPSTAANPARRDPARRDPARTPAPRTNDARTNDARANQPRADRSPANQPRGNPPGGNQPRGDRARGNHQLGANQRSRADHGRSPPEGERLQKVLARLGVASRREAEDWIRAGRITVNGELAVLGARVGRSDHLRLDGRLIHRHEIAAGQVYLCHRSPGENLRTPNEPSEHQALVERLPKRAGNRFITISPMPRIDGGLELVTSDGELATTLQRTIHSLPSEFSVRVKGELNEGQLRSILEGTLDRGERLRVESCEASGGEAANRWYTIVARGGSGKDVRQLFERQGGLVSRVLRTRVGTLELDRHLSRGQFRPLTQDEIAALTSPPEPATPAQD